MPRFFAASDAVDAEAKEIVIGGDDARHISRSLRMRCGEEITVCDGAGTDYRCRTAAFTSDTVTLRIERIEPASGESPVDITVFQALVKGDRFDTVIQKSVECGALEVIPFHSRNCVVRPSDNDDKKRERRERIALEAAMQSGRGRIPHVGECISSFDALISAASGFDAALFCYEGEGTESVPAILRRLAARDEPIKRICVIVGPEGGFTPEEAQAARDAGLTMTGLGPRILRTESAAQFALACIYFAFDT